MRKNMNNFFFPCSLISFVNAITYFVIFRKLWLQHGSTSATLSQGNQANKAMSTKHRLSYPTRGLAYPGRVLSMIKDEDQESPGGSPTKSPLRLSKTSSLDEPNSVIMNTQISHSSGSGNELQIPVLFSSSSRGNVTDGDTDNNNSSRTSKLLRRFSKVNYGARNLSKPHSLDNFVTSKSGKKLLLSGRKTASLGDKPKFQNGSYQNGDIFENKAVFQNGSYQNGDIFVGNVETAQVLSNTNYIDRKRKLYSKERYNEVPLKRGVGGELEHCVNDVKSEHVLGSSIQSDILSNVCTHNVINECSSEKTEQNHLECNDKDNDSSRIQQGIHNTNMQTLASANSQGFEGGPTITKSLGNHSVEISLQLNSTKLLPGTCDNPGEMESSTDQDIIGYPGNRIPNQNCDNADGASSVTERNVLLSPQSITKQLKRYHSNSNHSSSSSVDLDKVSIILVDGQNQQHNSSLFPNHYVEDDRVEKSTSSPDLVQILDKMRSPDSNV